MCAKLPCVAVEPTSKSGCPPGFVRSLKSRTVPVSTIVAGGVDAPAGFGFASESEEMSAGAAVAQTTARKRILEWVWDIRFPVMRVTGRASPLSRRPCSQRAA